MPLLNDILVWATAHLTMWQRDALRRLFQQQELSGQDLDDLYAMLKSAHGLPDPGNRQPVPLAQEHLPASSVNASSITLRSLRDLKHVNKIAAGQKLGFSPKGMTIVYGGNASGKSGYSRVLKRACRARDLTETVHTDAFDPNSSTDIPEAVFDIEVGGTPISVTWKRDTPPPDELSTIAVFDGRCARAYLDAEQDAAYVPYGLDIVENLAQRVLPALSERLDTEIRSIDTDTAPFADLQGNTAVGQIISSLSAATDPTNVTALGTVTPAEAARQAELEKALAESDPKGKAKALRLSAQRIDALLARVDVAASWVSDVAVERLGGYDGEAETAAKAEAIAAAAFRAGDSLLPGTGEQVWKSLFEAARRFSTEAACPGNAFPYIGPDAKCVLCQQPLDPNAAGRMQRFEDYVKRDTARVAAAKRQQVDAAEKKIRAATLTFGIDAAVAGELEQLDPSVLTLAQEFEKKIETRKSWMLAALKSHAWTEPPALNADLRSALKLLSERLVAQAVELEKVADEQQRKALEAERSELRARVQLSQRLKPVLDAIQRIRRTSLLTKCKDDLKTKATSDKAKQFARAAVTEALRNALNAEFQALGVGHIKTKLNERVVQGKTTHKLVLDLPVTKRLDEILSEGEQRAIAVGSFLAELHLAGHQGAIVFDDPVSSLDHHWRRNVARRLVKEAAKRQVIVLTHDTAFLGELLDEIEQQNVEHTVCHLEWIGEHPGHVNDGLPWEHQPYKERLAKIEQAQKSLEKTWPPYPNEADRDKLRGGYDMLRATIERVIQDVVFNGVVKRYRDWVRVDKLHEVVGFTECEHKEIARLHKTCCDVVRAHDPSSAKNASVPTPKQLGQDIADLKAVVESIRVRRKKATGVGAPGAPST